MRWRVHILPALGDVPLAALRPSAVQSFAAGLQRANLAPGYVGTILQTLSAIRAFDIIYVLTAGGPGTSTTTLTWKTYLTTFENLDFGLGNAYAYAVSLITFGFALVYFRVLYRRGDFET